MLNVCLSCSHSTHVFLQLENENRLLTNYVKKSTHATHGALYEHTTQQDHDNWTHTTGYVTHNVNTARP